MPDDAINGRLWFSEYLSPSHRLMHAVEEVLATAKTEFQRMQIVRSATFGKALVLDGNWQSATADEFIYHESLVHPAMVAHGRPRKVLILGGGEGATSREVLRWKSVERAVMVDIDGEVVEACREHLPEMHQGAFDDPRHELVVGDALAYLEATDERWDVVISDLSDPVEHGPSFQLFTREYFARVRAVMAEGGTLALQAGPVSPVDLAMHARLASTVRDVFAHVHSYHATLPSFGTPWGFCVAAESALPPLSAEQADAMLTDKLGVALRFLDGAMLGAQRCLPPYLQQAIDAETRVYTLTDPPKYGETD